MIIMEAYSLNDLEIRLLRELNDKFHEGSRKVDNNDIQFIVENERRISGKVIDRLENYAFIKASHGETEITDSGINYLYWLDNPPPKDYWRSFTTWFKSKWWSVPFFIFFVSIPLIVSWTQITDWLIKVFFN